MTFFQQLTQRQFKDLGSDRHYGDVLSQFSCKIWVNVLNQVKNPIRDQVHDQVRNQVRNNLS
jgi:hypothetical protein